MKQEKPSKPKATQKKKPIKSSGKPFSKLKPKATNDVPLPLPLPKIGGRGGPSQRARQDRRRRSAEKEALADDLKLRSIAIQTQNPKPEPEPIEVELPAPPVSVSEVLDVGSTQLISALRFVEPSWRNYIHYVQADAASGNLDAKRYLDTYLSLTADKQRRHVPEQLCYLTGTKPEDLIAWVNRQLYVESAGRTAMLTSNRRDKVLEKVADFAMESADNYKHAELFMKASGAIATGGRGGGGSPVTIFNAPIASASSQSSATAASISSSMSGAMKSMDEEIIELSKIMQTEDAPISARAETSDEQNDPDDDDEDDDSEDDDDE